MTASERRLWAELRKLELHFRRQVPIGRYIADFASHNAKLVVEVDGLRHDLPDQQLHDVQRDAWLASAGYQVVRVRDTLAYEYPEQVARQIVTLPPRGGKGRDGGECIRLDNLAQVARPLGSNI